MRILIDPEFKALIPPLTNEEYHQLEVNLKREGCRDNLITWNDILIDGHNRYEICTKNHIYFKAVDVNEVFNVADIKTRTDVIKWIINNQFGRRNISIYDRSVLALKLKENIAIKAKENLKTHTEQGYQISDKAEKVNTSKELAKIAGVSHDTIHKVEVIETQAPAQMKTQVKAGELSINQAYILTKSATETKKKNEEYERQYQDELEKERQASLEKKKQEELEASLPVNAVVLDKFRKQETHIFGITDFNNLTEEQWGKCVQHAKKYEDPIYSFAIAYTDTDSLRAWECIIENQEELDSQKESINLAIQNLIKIQNYFKGVKR